MNVIEDNDLLFIEKFLRAFKCLGGNKHGNIKQSELKNVLIRKCGMKEEDVEQLLEENNIIDNELNYVDMCISVLSNRVIFNRITLENGMIVSPNSGINSRTFTRKKHVIQSSDKNGSEEMAIKPTLQRLCWKGTVLNTPQGFLSHRYKLEVDEDAWVEISAKPLCESADSTKISPIEVLIFMDNKDSSKPLIAHSSIRNSEGGCTAQCSLKKGTYIVVPIILSWNESTDAELPDQDLLTVTDDDGRLMLTSACEKALRVVFDCIDLDGNGLLNQLEFDLYIRYISGETALDEWSTVEDNFTMEKRQLTFQGFLELYKLALETDPDDVISMFHNMGMDDSLELKNALPFLLVVNSDTAKIRMEPASVSPFGTMVDKVMRRLVVENGNCSKVKNMNDLFLYSYKLPHRTSVVIQNQSHSKVRIRFDCSESENCFSHRKNLDFAVEVAPRTSMVGHHLFPCDSNSPWKVECKTSLLK